MCWLENHYAREQFDESYNPSPVVPVQTEQEIPDEAILATEPQDLDNWGVESDTDGRL